MMGECKVNVPHSDPRKPGLRTQAHQFMLDQVRVGKAVGIESNTMRAKQ
jgi:hypothetical protein